MLNKITKLFGIIVVGAVLFASSPAFVHAQYYYNSPLTITTTNATNITGSGATLNGLVNGSNLYSTYNTATWFEYGTNTSFGYSTVHINPNSGYANFSATVGNLSPNTTYYFRAVGQNGQGVISYGNSNTFTTNFDIYSTNYNYPNSTATYNYQSSLSVITNPATSVSSRGAKLNALINNVRDNPSNTWFEWGTTASLGEMTPMVFLGTMPAARHINTITGLAPNTTYYFRAVVQNSSSTVNGATLSFTTGSAPSASSSTTQTTNNSVTNTSEVQSASSTLGANAVDSGTFLPTTLLGWLLLIILILALVLLAKHLYRQFKNQKHH